MYIILIIISYRGPDRLLLFIGGVAVQIVVRITRFIATCQLWRNTKLEKHRSKVTLGQRVLVRRAEVCDILPCKMH